MQIVLRDDNAEFFNVFLNDVQFDCDEESGHQEPMSNVFLTVEASDLADQIHYSETDSVDFEDIFLVCLEKLSDQTGFCITDFKVDRIVYVDSRFNRRVVMTTDDYHN